jgi:hypothetical protein
LELSSGYTTSVRDISYGALGNLVQFQFSGSPCLQQAFSLFEVDNTVYTNFDGPPEFALTGASSFISAGTPWPDATDLVDGWKQSSWFGDFNVNSHPWIYHAQHGWMYVFGTDPASIWLWTPDMGFLWTGSGVYSWLWSDQKGTWLWYQKGSTPPRWFYNWNLQKWESHNP